MKLTEWIKKPKINIQDKVKTLTEKHISRGMSEAEARALAEMQLLKPKKLDDLDYLQHKSNLYNAITFYFKSKSDFELVMRYFKVSDYLGYNTHDTDLLIKLLKKLDAGEIKVDN